MKHVREDVNFLMLSSGLILSVFGGQFRISRVIVANMSCEKVNRL